MHKTAIFILILLIACLPVRIYSSLDVSAESAVLMDAETGRIIYEKNAEQKLPMASTTKIITAITAIKYGNLSDVVTVSHNAATTEGSSVWLSEGEKLTLYDLLYAMMLESGNDASVAVAEHIGGNVESFAELMNKVCVEAGAFSTNCITPSGLDDELHYTTAKDMARIAKYAAENEVFREIVSTYKTTIPWEGKDYDRTLVNHNKLLSMYEGADGIKTGYTKKSGRCLVSSAEKYGWRLIAVTLNAPDDWNDHIKMLNYAYDNFSETEILVEQGAPMGNVSVIGSEKKNVSFGSGEDVSVRKLFGKEEMKIITDIPDILTAPIKKGEKIGSADVIFGTDCYKTISLFALEDVIRDDNVYIVKGNFIKLLELLLGLVR